MFATATRRRPTWYDTDGQRAALLEIEKSGNASTLTIIQQVKDLLPRIAAGLPKELSIGVVGDQSVFVSAAITGVVREGLMAAALTAAMILIFLSNWRATLIILVTIPLSVLTSLIALSALGQSINVMTLGGLALAVGILVDDATVAIENISHLLEQGMPKAEAIRTASAQIALAHARLDACDLDRVSADVPAHGRGSLPVRAARRSGRLRNDRLLLLFPNVDSDARDVSVARAGEPSESGLFTAASTRADPLATRAITVCCRRV